VPRPRLIALLALAVAVLGPSACSGPLAAGGTVTQVRDAAGVTSVVLATSGDLVIDHLTSRVDDGTLHLGGSGVRGEVRYRLTTPSLDSVVVRGSGAVDADLAAESVTTELSSAGRVAVAGTAASQVVAVEGSGDDAAFDLATEDATVAVHGSGSAQVTVAASLDAAVDGSGSVTHRGGARVEQDVDGSGSVAPG